MKITRRTLFGVAALPAIEAAGAAVRTKPAHTAQIRSFRGESLREIAFPLGGIGTGTVCLNGYGALRDWEIFNRPNKGSVLPFTFAALRAAAPGAREPWVRVVERQPLPPFAGGFGYSRETAAGLPRFREATFTGLYPMAEMLFRDPSVPLSVDLEAWNPMVPLDTASSSLPAAILTYRVRSRARARLQAALAFSLMNPVGYDGVARLSDRSGAAFGQNVNEFRQGARYRGLFLHSRKYQPDSTRYGSLALLTTAENVSYRAAWQHGEWFDEFQKWWDEFVAAGRFPSQTAPPSPDKSTEYCTIAAHFDLDPGESREITFVLSWHFPNTENYWTAESPHHGEAIPNRYGAVWPSAWDAGAHVMEQLPILRRRTLAYVQALRESTLPPAIIDAVSSQASILRTNTVMVLGNKQTLAFEGCGDHGGCCPMNCTHVYNYEQAMAHLFPELERSMREIDFLTNLRPDGAMSFRTPVPLRAGGDKEMPAADGQMGCILKVYREWQFSGDTAWLRRLWPAVKKALEYAWLSWDANRDGVMEGEQHNTYDIEFYGPNSMMGTLYLGALAAAARMAEALDDAEAAARYGELFRKGSALLDQLTWNGEYYVQKIPAGVPGAAKYQYGEGCLSDQLLGQWFCEVADLGKTLPHEHVKAALRSIYRYNFRRSFDGVANAQRIYALNDERGLLLCSWPHGHRPELPFVYSDEVWTGIEYQVAAHLIYEGLVEEGLAVVEGARGRYDGARRNPWNEVECGHHYARAMSSWSLLTAASGFRYSGPRDEIGFHPRFQADDFRAFFSTGHAWGRYSQKRRDAAMDATLEVREGTLVIRSWRVPFAGARTLDCRLPARLSPAQADTLVQFDPPAHVGAGERLSVSLS